MQQSQDALDVGLATQALVNIERFDIQKIHHQLQDALDVGLATQNTSTCAHHAFRHTTISSSAAGRPRRRLGNKSSASYSL